MDKISVRLPKNWMIFFESREKIEEEIKKAIIMNWMGTHKISQGKGAELLGIDRWEFYELMARHNIATSDIPVEELAEGAEIMKRAAKG